MRFPSIGSFVGILVVVLAAACGGGGPSGPGQPMITAGSPPAGATGVAYSPYTFTVASGGVPPFSWSESGALPPGMSLSPDGQLTGTPVTAGTYAVTIAVSDSSMPALTGILSVSVTVADSPIVIATTPAPPAGTVTYAYPGFAFGIASGGSPPFTWKVTTGTPPPGLTLGSDGSLSGTPTSVGSATFTVTATDSASPAGTGSQPFSVVINNPAAPVITQTPAPPAATNGTPYAFQFGATGGFQPLSWAVTTGAPPPGLTLASNGSLTGTPTTTASYTFTLTVTDSAATPETNSVPFTIVVNNPPPPAISNTPPPTATVGTPYSFQFTATNGLAPLVWSATGLTSGLVVSLDGNLSGTPTSAGHFPIMVDVKDSLNRSAPSAPFTLRISLARPAASFMPTGSMSIARVGHSATLLTTGKVLVAGGADATAELYDPASGMFTATGSMTEARTNHTATLLEDSALPNYGKVLIVGSVDATAELYDPSGAGTFTATGSMTTARTHPTATLLTTGKVLVVGGNTVAGDLTAELYDPATGTFKATGSLSVLRIGHTATRLLDGRVLVAGGGPFTSAASATAELYDPMSGTFTATGSMTVPRTEHAATLLQDGTVLMVGTDGSTDLYDPSGAGTFAAVGNAPLAYGLYGHTASLRNDGTVLVAGDVVSEEARTRFYFGCRLSRFPVSLANAELFAPESQGFTATGSLNTPRDGHTATVLADGTVLIVGGLQHKLSGAGFNCSVRGSAIALSSAELFK
jgi:hypothetical protein